MKRAFTLIELLVVIAIIAILAAILFPVFAQAKLAAKQTAALTQMKQLATGIILYAGDNDDFFAPASGRTFNPADTPVIWTEIVYPYVKNEKIFIAPDSNGAYAHNWAERRSQSVGYSDATGVDPLSTAVDGAAPAGTEGFAQAAVFTQIEESAKVGLFALTANAKAGDTSTKHRGYVFNPYNGLNSPDGDYSKGLPMISDRDLVTDAGDANYPGSPSLAPGALKPILARYAADNKGNGRTPVIFSDGHTKVYSAKALNTFGTVIWRFR